MAKRTKLNAHPLLIGWLVVAAATTCLAGLSAPSWPLSFTAPDGPGASATKEVPASGVQSSRQFSFSLDWSKLGSKLRGTTPPPAEKPALGGGQLGAQEAAAKREHKTSGPDTGPGAQTTTPLSPVILLPGYGGSRLEAKWNKTHAEHYVCDHSSDWTRIWINVKQMLPYMIDCLVENFRLDFDPATNTTRNTEGVEVRVESPHLLSTVEYLNNVQIPTFGYFSTLIDRLINKLGYTRDVNLRGAPYDFRKAPNELADYFANLRRTSEELMAGSPASGGVTYICHSMGCNNILYFLQNQSQAWKDRHVRRVISIAAPWAGSVAALRAVALGDNLGLPYLLDETVLNRVQRSLPSTIYLLPNRRVFGSMPLIREHVSGPRPKSFTAEDYNDYFASLRHPDGLRMWHQTRDLLGSLQAPQVEVHCLFGEKHMTEGRLEFEGAFPNSQVHTLYDDGDGTVTKQSSTYCKEWVAEQRQPIHVAGFDAVHNAIHGNNEVLDYIEELLRPAAELGGHSNRYAFDNSVDGGGEREARSINH